MDAVKAFADIPSCITCVLASLVVGTGATAVYTQEHKMKFLQAHESPSLQCLFFTGNGVFPLSAHNCKYIKVKVTS